jgi:hypothetical protein
MPEDFPLVSPLTMPFSEMAEFAPVVRASLVAVERAVGGEIPRIRNNEGRVAFWRRLSEWAAKNEANVSGILAGREERALGAGGT